MRFFTAGIPLSTQGSSTEEGLLRVKELGLDGMELEFVRGIRMGEDKAKRVRKIAEENHLSLSVHAPYWINLNAKERDKLEASIERIYESARVGFLAGARDITFHPAYYFDDDPKDVHRKVKGILRELVDRIKGEKIEVILRPETTGKPTQYGSLEEILELSAEIEGVMPCIDFAHLHARSGGKFNTVEEFRYVLEKVKEYLGERGIKNMHIHMSGIAYSSKGEKHHLNLEESDLRWREILEVLCDFGVDGFIVSESPNIEGDAILMKDHWKKICGS
ncbi:MAG: TIM barrel protein [Candidatus Caldipriscus sp.]|nr:TIM barrel protein [Candidatus Caldipriscus sp.]